MDGYLCKCGSKYQDPDSGRCFLYFECPFFDYLRSFKDEKAWDRLHYDEDVAHLVRNTDDTLNNYMEGNIVGKLLKDHAVLILKQILKMKGIRLSISEIEKSKDLVLIKECFAEKLEEETMKYSKKMLILFNLFIKHNKKLNDLCHRDEICKLYEILNSHKHIVSVHLAHVIPGIINILIKNLKELKTKSKYFCWSNHCGFLDELLKDEDLLIEFLRNIIKEKHEFAKYIVNVALSGRKTVERYVNSKY